jgi:AAA domain
MVWELHARTGLKYKQLPQVTTIDGIQGHESGIVICDWVNTAGDKSGFIADNRWANITLICARASMIVAFRDGEEIFKPKKKASKFRNQQETSLEVISYWNYLKHTG